MINFKVFQVESLGPLMLLGAALLVLVGVVHLVFQVLLNIGFVDALGPIKISDTLLFLIFLTQVNVATSKCSQSKK